MTSAGFVLSHEQFVVVGGRAEAEESARMWRFIPKAWDEFVDNPGPRDILRRAEAELSDEDVYSNWLVSDDSKEHADSIKELFDAGVSKVYIYSGQADQQSIIDFYGNKVLPLLRST